MNPLVQPNGPSLSPPEPEILVVDDEVVVLETLLLELEAAGYSPTGFHEPLDALMHASDAEPCCIIVDLKLPGIDGLDLIAAFAAMRRHAIIVVSAFISVADTVAAMQLGCKHVFLKPVSSEQLFAKVAEVLTELGSAHADETLTFTRRERQVGELLMQGLTTKKIALQLQLSPRTVDFFRGSLLRKTTSSNTAALVVALGRVGFAGPKPPGGR